MELDEYYICIEPTLSKNKAITLKLAKIKFLGRNKT